MGGAVSSGKNNDELIDNLKDADYIKTPEVERVFRIVDRAHYYLAECRDGAYKDLAWKNGTLHLSAPCIYSEVMEALELMRGMSFLNLGSGTGYLNTMVGLMIGPYGINHGIELHADNVTYAREKLESFIQTSPRFDDVEFCEPQFVVGNCLNLAPENRLYDRVYCGASCPVEQKEAIQNMIKINGILVIPVGDQLLKIRRISETEFTSDSVLPVSFASLVLPVPAHNNVDPIVLPEVDPPSLQCICRLAIRSAVRDTFDFKTDSQSQPARASRTHQTRCTKFFRPEGGHYDYPLNILPTAQGLMIMGAFDHSDDEDDHDDDIEEEDADASGHSDDNIFDLDRQLRHHANELRRARQRSMKQEEKESIEDVDSDLSDNDEEEEEDVAGQSSQAKDVNGNKNGLLGSSDDKKTAVEPMESDDGASGDREEFVLKAGKSNGLATGEGFSGQKEKKKKGKIIGRKQKANGISSGSPSASGYSHSSRYERIADRILTIMSPKLSNPSSSKTKAVVSTSSSLDDGSPLPDNEATTSKSNTRSLAIEVTSTGGSLSEPRAIKESYSTSADTSETSGFGSLGDDALHVGSHHSGLGSLNDDMELMSGDVFMPASSIPAQDNTTGSWPESLPGESSVDTNTKVIDDDDDDDDSGDTGWMDIEEEDESSEDENIKNDNDIKRSKSDAESKSSKIHERDDLIRCEEEVDDNDDDDDSKQSPRGPDFSAFLKAKVETLPLPSTLKAFILYYR